MQITFGSVGYYRIPLPLGYVAEVAESRRTSAKVAGLLVGIVFFFIATLLVSFFGIIVLINEMDILGDVAPNVFMIGLIPPSILSILLYTKVLSKFF